MGERGFRSAVLGATGAVGSEIIDVLEERSFPVAELRAYASAGGSEIDFQGRTLRVDGSLVETSKKEFELLRLLVRNRGRVLSRDQILNRVWGYDYYGTPRTIDNFIQKLREKVEKDAAQPEYIRTVRGVGYRFEPAGE